MDLLTLKAEIYEEDLMSLLRAHFPEETQFSKISVRIDHSGIIMCGELGYTPPLMGKQSIGFQALWKLSIEGTEIVATLTSADVGIVPLKWFTGLLVACFDQSIKRIPGARLIDSSIRFDAQQFLHASWQSFGFMLNVGRITVRSEQKKIVLEAGKSL